MNLLTSPELVQAQLEVLDEILLGHGIWGVTIDSHYDPETYETKFSATTIYCKTSGRLTFEQMQYFLLGYALNN